MQNKFRFEKRLSGYVRKWFICYSPASSGGKSLGMQGTVSNNPAVPIETLKTIPDCKVCVFPCSLISLLTTFQLILFKAECTKNVLCLQEVPDSEVSYKFCITYFGGNFNLSFEQSQVELMVTLKIPSWTDNTKRSASLNLWFLNNMDGSWTKLWKNVHRSVCADAIFISTDSILSYFSVFTFSWCSCSLTDCLNVVSCIWYNSIWIVSNIWSSIYVAYNVQLSHYYWSLVQ